MQVVKQMFSAQDKLRSATTQLQMVFSPAAFVDAGAVPAMLLPKASAAPLPEVLAEEGAEPSPAAARRLRAVIRRPPASPMTVRSSGLLAADCCLASVWNVSADACVELLCAAAAAVSLAAGKALSAFAGAKNARRPCRGCGRPRRKDPVLLAVSCCAAGAAGPAGRCCCDAAGCTAAVSC